MKQGEDEKWNSYYRTLVVANGFQNIEADIVSKTLEIQSGKTLDEVLADVATKNKEGIEKLLKIAVRTSWAKKCVDEGKLAIAENREPNYPVFPIL
jgi:hypothetical protein